MSDLDRLFDEHMQEAFGDRRQEFTVQLTNQLRKLWLMALQTRAGEDVTARDEEAFLTGVYGRTYPAVADGMAPKLPASSDRDTRRPMCGGCGGTGMGDYPYACNTCGGTGNS